MRCLRNHDVGWQQIEAGEVEIHEQIGGGGVALVYRGLWGGHDVAIKTLFDPKVDDALHREYMDEVLVMSKLRHTNVVRFLGANMQPPKLFFVMELCDRSLHEIIHGRSNRRPLLPSEKLRMAGEVAAGMGYLHSRNPAVIHRDLKPLNVLEAKSGAMKICDFGLCKTRNPGAGTAAYMAPELFNGRSYSKAVDVFAFGVLLCELFAGVIPFREFEYGDVRKCVAKGGRPDLPKYDTPDPVRRLIVECWDEDHTRRPTFDRVATVIQGAKATTRDASHTDELTLSGDCLDDLLGSHK